MVTLTLSHSVWQFDKSRATHAMCASMVYVPMGKVQTRASFSFLRVNVSINVPTCQRCANYLTWHASAPKAWQLFNLAWKQRVPKGMPNFKTFFLRNVKGNFYTLLLYKKFYIILDIIVIHMICICFVYENCFILYFYTSSHIKEKCAELLFSETFLFFSLKWKHKKTWFL